MLYLEKNTVYSMSPSPWCLLLGRPEYPRSRDTSLDDGSHPHRDRDVARPPRDPTSGDGANQEHGKAEEPPVSNRVLRRPYEQIRVGGEVVKDRRDDHGRDLGEFHVSAETDLAGCLEAEKSDGDLMDPVDVISDELEPAFEGSGLDQDRAEEDDTRLKGERIEQCTPAGRSEAAPES